MKKKKKKRGTRYSFHKARKQSAQYVVDNLYILNEKVARGVIINSSDLGSCYTSYLTRISNCNHVGLILKILKIRGLCLYLSYEHGKIKPNQRFISNIKLLGFNDACSLELDLVYNADSMPRNLLR
jgi:hypothetical protein